ncbi:MAG: SH3 domain-containing protein [Treponema sp.]|nr:SH3 domain-containing protein [Treponema sp.]
MKNAFAITFLALLIFAFAACEKKESNTQTVKSTDIPESSSSEPASAGTPGYVLRVNASMYSLENDTGSEADRTKWEASMSLGEKVVVMEKRRATFSGDGKVYDFIAIRRDNGKEGFAWDSQIAAGSSLAVVTDDKANLFRSPKTIDVTGQILSRKTIVVINSDSESDGFAEIKAYDPVAQAYRQNFIRLSSISKKDSDIQSSILLQTAEPLKNEGSEKVRRDALLEAASLDYPDSAFSADINKLINPDTQASFSTESAGKPFMTVNDDNVNVRDIPDSSIGKVIGQLNKGDEVTVSNQTTETATIDGQSARWYRITEPVEGWVFGAFLN